MAEQKIVITSTHELASKPGRANNFADGASSSVLCQVF
jgi:hypothetical protein